MKWNRKKKSKLCRRFKEKLNQICRLSSPNQSSRPDCRAFNILSSECRRSPKCYNYVQEQESCSTEQPKQHADLAAGTDFYLLLMRQNYPLVSIIQTVSRSLRTWKNTFKKQTKNEQRGCTGSNDSAWQFENIKHYPIIFQRWKNLLELQWMSLWWWLIKSRQVKFFKIKHFFVLKIPRNLCEECFTLK